MKLIAITLLSLICLSALAMPPETEALEHEISTIPGITSTSISKAKLEGILIKNFSFPAYGSYPLGALKRTNGGLPHEILISVDFTISKDAKGLNALEFLSAWVRDSARGREPIQIRSLALPQIEGQIGETLFFTIDYFYIDSKEDPKGVLTAIGKLAKSLALEKSLLQHRK